MNKGRKTTFCYTLLNEVIEKIANETGIKFHFTVIEPKRNAFHFADDMMIELAIWNKKFKYNVQTAENCNLDKMRILLALQEDIYRNEKGLIIAHKFENNVMEYLRRNNITFADAFGNAFFKAGDIYIDIRGRKGKTNTINLNAFNKAGLKVIYALLCNPDLITATLRDINQIAGVALGTVKNTLDVLEKMKYVIKINGRKRMLNDKEGLLKRWCLEYADRLKPGLLIGRYEQTTKEKLRIIEHAYLGGENAAAKITGFLKPGPGTTIYIEKEYLGHFVKANRLKRNDEGGEIEIYDKFWLYETEGKLVCPILIYADLLMMGGKRAREVAEIIYEEKIAGYFI